MTPLVLPDAAGFEVGGVGIRSVYIGAHYDNPNKEYVPTRDRSGVRFYLSETPREHAVGVMEIGSNGLDTLYATRVDVLPRRASRHGAGTPRPSSAREISTGVIVLCAPRPAWPRSFPRRPTASPSSTTST